MADRRLHIAIDGRELVGQPTGVGRYLRQVLGKWSGGLASAHRLTVVLPQPPTDEHRLEFPTLEWEVEPAVSAGTAWEQIKLPRALRRLRPDVLFAVGYTAPIRRVCPFVVVVHDVSFIAHPEWFRWREGVRRRWLTRLTARRAHSVLTVSEFSASEIVRWTGISRDRIRLAPPCGPEMLAPSVPGPRPPVVLYVGSIFNRRHVPDLIEAFARARRVVPDARLVLVGDNRTSPPVDLADAARALGVEPYVTRREYVDDEELNRLYDEARVFAFLSEYEGFAMTPMEAIAHGAPAVMLDTPVAREVYGDGARLVPLDPDAIASALVSLLTDSGAHRAALDAGRRRLAACSWARTAATALEALEQAARP